MRWLVASFVLAAAGCGGGDGSDVQTLPAAQASRVEELLADCGADLIGTQLETARALLANLDPDQDEAPRLDFTSLVGRVVQWRLDVDDDGAVDYTGSLVFTDVFGVATAPFELTKLLDTNDRLPTFIAHIAEGNCELAYTSAAGTGSGTLRSTIKNGVPGRLAGSGVVATPDCVASFLFSNSTTLLLAQPTAPPFFRLDLEFQLGADRVYAIVTSGTSLVDVAVAAFVNDPARTGPSERFLVNLETGSVE